MSVSQVCQNSVREGEGERELKCIYSTSIYALLSARVSFKILFIDIEKCKHLDKAGVVLWWW